MTDSAPVLTKPTDQEKWRKLAISGGSIVGSAILFHLFLNRETNDGLSMLERSYLNDSFMYTGGGLALTAIASRALFKSGFAARLMAANPWVVLGVGLVGSVGSMMVSRTRTLCTIVINLCAGCIRDARRPTDRQTCILARIQRMPGSDSQVRLLYFQTRLVLTLRSPMFFFSPAILGRAALYTCGVVGALSYVGATAKYVP